MASSAPMEARVYLSGTDEFTLLTMIEGITQVNEHYLAEHPDTPPLYESGTFYEREGSPELWFDVGAILARSPPRDDCEGLGSWRAAELRRQGRDANAVLRRYERPDGSGVTYHCLTEIRDVDGAESVYDDPSARLGMLAGRPRIAGIDATHPESWKRCRTRFRLPRQEIGAAPLPVTVRLVTAHADGTRWVVGPGRRERMVAVAGDWPTPGTVLGRSDDGGGYFYYYTRS